MSEPLRRYSSLGVGGPAQALVFPANVDDLRLAVKFAREHEIPILILGAGSNLLIRDGGFNGLVINLCMGFKQIRHEGNYVYVQAGTHISKLLSYLQINQIGGLEFLVGVPGTIGGAIIMNAGASDGEIGQFVSAVSIFRMDGKLLHLTREQIDFGYRSSSLESQGIILEVEFELQHADADIIEDKMRQFLAMRKSNQPAGLSAGSIFKNPPGDYAGRLIEDSGLKGTKIGGAGIADQHANFILNNGSASAQDIESLIRLVQREVFEKKGIRLEPEVKIIGQEA